LIYRLIAGYEIPGMENYNFPVWQWHVGNVFGIIQLLLVLIVYNYSAIIIRSFSTAGGLTDKALVYLNKLVNVLIVLALVKLVTFFFFPSNYMGTIFDHFMNSNFMNRMSDDPVLIIYLTHAVAIISNIVRLFTIYVNPANCAFFIVVLKGIQKFYGENKILKTELESVV
jgi:hypothetical protein